MNQTINVSIPKALTDLAKQQVKAGYYASVSEVVRTALRNLFTESPSIPTIKLSKRAEAKFKQAEKDYREGKTISFTSFEELLK